MHKASVIPAAALAAVFLFGFSSTSEGKSAKTSKPSKTEAAASKSAPSKRAEAKRVPARKKKAPAVTSKARTSKQARHVIRQRQGGAVVLERVAVEMPPFYGPFLPVEVVDYPRPLCEPVDVVLEAHVHETDAETPEREAIEDDMPEELPSTLLRAARSFGSFLRPKSSQSTMRPEDVDLSELLSAGVRIPVEGVDASRLRDSFLSSRGRHRKHLAIDIGAPKGTPVLAAADGEIVLMRREKRGGISLYQKDPTGKYLLYYCHLSKYSRGLKSGDRVSRGDVIAYVGRTGHASGPHLHFSITRLPEDDENFKAGVAVNPYLLFLASVP